MTPAHWYADPAVWNVIATFAGAIATLSAVLVALFGQAFREKWFPPKLALSLVSRDGEFTRAVLQWKDEQGQEQTRRVPSRYYHLRVENARTWSIASGVQVIIRAILERSANGEFTPTWRGSLPLRWRHQELFPVTRTVGAHAAEADFVAVLMDKWLEIEALVHPANLELQRREAVTLVFHLQAVSDQSTSPIVALKVAWDGEWHDGTEEMRRHLTIEETSTDPLLASA